MMAANEATHSVTICLYSSEEEVLLQVKHLVKVELDSAREERLRQEAEKRKPLPHLVLKHS